MQLRFVLFGLAITFGLIFVTNFLLVVVFHNSSLISLGPAYTLIFSSTLAYAIVRHKLFDIKRAAARGLAYLLTLGFLGVAYSVAVFGLSTYVLNTTRVNSVRSLTINTLLALLLAFSFQKIKRFFDKLTNRIFYKDAYDTQSFLDELNSALASEVNLMKLLSDTRRIIESNLKTERCSFIISKTHYSPERYIDIDKARIDSKNVQLLLDGISQLKQKIVVADYLSDSDKDLSDLLNQCNISIVIRLSTNLSRSPGGIGEVLIGPKRNGDPYSNDDIKILEIIANELVIAIENALRFEEIEEFNATLQGKINEATLKLRRANDKLRALDETKDDFISMASHQLRTPLTSVKGYLSMVIDGDVGNITKTQKEMLGQAFFSSQRMVYLIADLLNVSRLKTGKFLIEATPVNLDEIVEQELGQLKETATSKGLKLTYDKPKDFPAVMLDETKTRQVIMNFADNAIYYTPSGGEIKVRLIDNPETIELRIEDNGLGVPKAEQHHLFTKFYRGSNARKARPDGTGLGLFMAKKVIAAEGGSIIFESTEGKGSTFGFIFSKAKLTPKPSTMPLKEEKKELAHV